MQQQQQPPQPQPQSNSSPSVLSSASKRRFRIDAYQLLHSIVGLKPWINQQIVFPDPYAPRVQLLKVGSSRDRASGPIDLEKDPEVHRELAKEEMQNLMGELKVFKFVHDALRDQVLGDPAPHSAIRSFQLEQSPSEGPGRMSSTPQRGDIQARRGRAWDLQRALRFGDSESFPGDKMDEIESIQGEHQQPIFKVERKQRESIQKAQKNQAKLQSFFHSTSIERSLAILRQGKN